MLRDERSKPMCDLKNNPRQSIRHDHGLLLAVGCFKSSPPHIAPLEVYRESVLMPRSRLVSLDGGRRVEDVSLRASWQCGRPA